MQLNQLEPDLISILENELAASAAGFPGAHEDMVTYIRGELLCDKFKSSAELEELIREGK